MPFGGRYRLAGLRSHRPLAVGGENYRRSSPNVTVYSSHPALPAKPARPIGCAPTTTRFTAEQVVIAAGSRAMVPEARRPVRVDVHTSDSIMRLAALPEHLLIIGGGFVAAEFAHVFSALGGRITMVIRGGTLLSHCDDLIGEGSPILPAKWEIHSHRTVAGAHRDGTEIVVELDDSSTLRADTVLVATGRIPTGIDSTPSPSGYSSTAVAGRRRVPGTTARGLRPR